MDVAVGRGGVGKRGRVHCGFVSCSDLHLRHLEGPKGKRRNGSAIPAGDNGGTKRKDSVTFRGDLSPEEMDQEARPPFLLLTTFPGVAAVPFSELSLPWESLKQIVSFL